MNERTPVEPGSPLPLTLFTAWCRTQLLLALLAEEATDLLFMDGHELDEPCRLGYSLSGSIPSLAEFLDPLVAAAAAAGSSQVGACLSSPGWPRQLLLVCVDETGLQIEQAIADPSDEGVALSTFRRVDLPISSIVWQQQLGAVAGYRSVAKWRCQRCESVCIGEIDEHPSPCCYCASGDVVAVELTTPLASPIAPWDEHYDDPEAALLRSPFAQELFSRFGVDVAPEQRSPSMPIVRRSQIRLRRIRNAVVSRVTDASVRDRDQGEWRSHRR